MAQCLRSDDDCLSKAKKFQKEYDNKSYGMSGLEPEKVAQLAGEVVTKKGVIRPDNLTLELKKTSDGYNTSSDVYLYKHNHLTRLTFLGKNQCQYSDSNGGSVVGKCKLVVPRVQAHLSTEYDGETRPVSYAVSKRPG